MIEASSPCPGEAFSFDRRQQSADLGRTLAPDLKRLVELSLSRPPGRLQAQPADRRDLRRRHLVEAPHPAPARRGGALQSGHYFQVGLPQPDDLVVSATFPIRNRVRKVTMRDKDRRPVLDNEGLPVAGLHPYGLHFLPALAGAKHHRNPARLQRLQRRTGRLQRVGIVVQQGAVQICENNVRHGVFSVTSSLRAGPGARRSPAQGIFSPAERVILFAARRRPCTAL